MESGLALDLTSNILINLKHKYYVKDMVSYDDLAVRKHCKTVAN